MNPIVTSYTIYLVISTALTIWVATTLHRNGRVFLTKTFKGDEELADSVNHLLRVGFYLVNLGFVSLALKTREVIVDARGSIELLSLKIGVVLAILGAMHFLNLFIFARIAREKQPHRGRGERVLADTTPPINPMSPIPGPR